jgi:hypothetical protein
MGLKQKAKVAGIGFSARKKSGVDKFHAARTRRFPP